jgi:hypothetical protein
MSGKPLLIRPSGSEGAARMVYDRRRADELKRGRARLRADLLEAARRKLDLLDLEIAGLNAIRTRELKQDLAASGFNTTGLKPVRLPTELEREARRRRGRPDVDPLTRSRAEEAASRGRLIRVFHTAHHDPINATNRMNKPLLLWQAPGDSRFDFPLPDVVMADV